MFTPLPPGSNIIIPPTTPTTEKPSKQGLLKFLPGSAAAAIPFRIPSISPKRLKSRSFYAWGPSSPMVSCVGQIKRKKKKKKKIQDPTKLKWVLPPQRQVIVEDPHHADDVKNKRQRQRLKSLVPGFLKGINHGKKSKKNAIQETYVPPNNDIKLPYLGSVTKFASGRGSLAGFDCRAFGVVVAPNCSEPCLDEEEERNMVKGTNCVGAKLLRALLGRGRRKKYGN